MTGGIMFLIASGIFAAFALNEEAPELFNEIIDTLTGGNK